MRRREFLAGIAATIGGLSGCVSINSPNSDSPNTSPSTGNGSYNSTLASSGFPPTVCEEEINVGGILAIVEPEFGRSWDGIEVDQKYSEVGGLADSMNVIGIKNGDEARAYPLSVLFYHEIVNDTLGDPLLVTFCPICNSGMTMVRLVNGEPTIFGVSGLLWQAPGVQTANSEITGRVFGAALSNSTDEPEVRNSGNLVMFDEATRSYWSQILGKAICGPRTGDTLPIVPSTYTNWGEWKRENPDTQVLLPPPYSKLMSEDA